MESFRLETKNRWALSFVLCVVLSSPCASLSLNLGFCLPSLWALNRPPTAAKLLSQNKLRERLQSGLEPLRQGKVSQLQHQVPASLELGSNLYPILSVLGSGGDGDVYLTTLKGRKVVLKEFRYPERLKENLIELRKRRTKYKLHPLRVDHARRRVLFPYIEGISIEDIIMKRKLLGITQQEVQEIVALSKIATPKELPANVILELHSGRFYLIDPH